jgi:hypothetical protein
MSEQENGREADIQTRIAEAGYLHYGSAEWQELLPEVARLLGVNLDVLRAGGNRMIGLTQVAKLAGVAPGTAIQWRQRTRRGELVGAKAFPDPDDATTFPDKPMWRLETVLRFLLRAGKWPLGAAGRPLERGSRQAATAG